MRLKFAIHNNKVHAIEFIVIGGRINIKHVEPNTEFIPASEFDRNLIFNTKYEAKKYLDNEKSMGISDSKH